MSDPLNRLPKKVLEIYQSHLTDQTVEIQNLEAHVSGYRKKFGDLDLSKNAEFEKARLERELQETRQKNNEMNLSIQTTQTTLEKRKEMVVEMERAIKEITAKMMGDEDKLTSIEERVQALEEHNTRLDGKIGQIQTELQKMLKETS